MKRQKARSRVVGMLDVGPLLSVEEADMGVSERPEHVFDCVKSVGIGSGYEGCIYWDDSVAIKHIKTIGCRKVRLFLEELHTPKMRSNRPDEKLLPMTAGTSIEASIVTANIDFFGCDTTHPF